MEGKLTITVHDGKINIEGEMRDLSPAGELTIAHTLLRAMGYTGDKLVHALAMIASAEHFMEESKAEESGESKIKKIINIMKGGK